ncbi:hypothetical protein AX17_004904 [Amanita inopinata Kibby_2008]|nr:hypothetical protein AX17_004904 [Amanita inopinata Kibby_2008]
MRLQVAAKLLRIDGDQDKVEARMRFQRYRREIKVWSGCKHGNILKLLGVINWTGVQKPGFVSPRQRNGTVLMYIENNRGVDKHDIITGIAEGVEYLHKMKKVHGDIKARNILISSEGIPKICDFGLSRILDHHDFITYTKHKGTYSYTAPEVLNAVEMDEEGTIDALGVYTRESDVYAFSITVAGFVAEIKKIPPVTRFLCASSLGVTVPVLLQIVSPYKILFVRELVTQRFEIWRLCTSFFLGSGGINYIFEFVMLYRTANQLESGPYARKSADFAWQLLFVGASIIAACLPLRAYIFARPLLVALTYLSSVLAPPGTQTSLMGLLTLPVKYLPYIMIAMDLLMAGPAAAAQGIAGAVVGHFWWWSVWGTGAPGQRPLLESFGRAPGWLRSLIGGDGPAAAGGGPVGGVHVIPPRRPAAADSGSTSGYNWGTGQRLGS